MGELQSGDNDCLDGCLQKLQTETSSSRLALISSLRGRGIGDHINLPQLVVCGDQSAGKSSVLEGITGIPFPCQDGLCTRFATEITLEHSETVSSIKASIIPASARDNETKERLKSYNRQLDSFAELPDVISQVGERIGLRGAAAETFGQDVLRIKVTGKTGLHLTIVDLPGLISTPNEDQTDADVDTVHGLVDLYVANPRTIILAVVQAGNDIANQPIVKKSKKFDKKGERTIGIITKPDLLNEGSESRIALLARNEDTTKLKLGFFIVKNPTPSQLDAGVSLEERERHEDAFFSSPPWSNQRLAVDRAGIRFLRIFLQGLLDRHMEREMPKVREEVRTLLKTAEKDIERLGEERSTPAHIRAFLSRLSMRYHAVTAAALQGDYNTMLRDFFDLTLNNTEDSVLLYT